MKYLLVLFFSLFLCLDAGAETLYVCPASGEYGTEDGSSLANCFDGTADVSWGVGAGSVSAGDTLCVSGNFTGSSESDVSGITLRVDTSGTDANTLVTVDGDCDGDGVKAEFDGDNAVGIAIRTAIVGTSRTTYLRIKNIVMRQYTNKAVVTYNVTGDETSDANQIWTGIEIYDHGDGGAGDNCFDSRGRYITLSDSIISGCDDDGVFHQGKYFTSDNLSVSDVSRATVTGDGIQIGGEGDGYSVTNFYCDHSAVDSKQCFITSVLSDTGANGILSDAEMHCKRGATSQNCAFVTGANAVVRRIFTDGGKYGIAVEDSTDSNGLVVESSIAINATADGIAVFGTNPTGINIRDNVSAFNGDRGIEIVPTNAMTIQNNIAYMNAGFGINRAHSSQVESYNASFGNTAGNFALTGSSTSAGTGSITTDPQLSGGITPSTPAGFKLLPSSPARRAGLDLNIGNIQDHGNRAFAHPPSIGAWEVTSGSEASSRTNATTRAPRQ